MYPESYHQWYETDTILDVKKIVSRQLLSFCQLKVVIEGVTGTDDLEEGSTLNSYKSQATFNIRGEMTIRVKICEKGNCYQY